MEYLVQQNRRVAGPPVLEEPEITAKGKNVIVLGGGDTSADCLGNANREGAESVRLLTHGSKPPETPDKLTWPDWPLILHKDLAFALDDEDAEKGYRLICIGSPLSDVVLDA